MTLYLSQKKLLLLLLWSFALGFLLALLYDLFRLSRRHRRPKKKGGRLLGFLLVTIEDFLFFVFCGVVASILFFVINNGRVRPSAFLAGALGFALCRMTLSRLFLAMGERVIALGKRLFVFLFQRLFLPPLQLAARLFSRLHGALYARKRKRDSARLYEKLKKLGQNGYFEGLRRL